MRRLAGSNFLFICLLIWPLSWQGSRAYYRICPALCSRPITDVQQPGSAKCGRRIKEAAHPPDRCWRPLKCFVRFEISRISSSDVCRNCKLCFLTPAGRFNESFCKVKCRGVKLFHRKEKKFTLSASVRSPAKLKARENMCFMFTVRGFEQLESELG